MSATPAPRRRRPPARLFTHVVVALPIVGALALIAWMGFFAPAKVADQNARFQVKAGRPLPRMPLRDAAGKRTTLAQVLGGAPALVVIMDPTCVHCETEIQSVRALLRERRSEAAPRVVLVSAGASADLAGAAAKYPDLPVYDDHTGAVGRLGLTMVPAHFSVGADGVVRDARVGVQSPEYLRDVIRDVVEAPSRPRS